MLFADRVDAGRALAGGLAHLQHEDVVVLGLPRGGVPVAYEVAEALGKPLDVIVVRKLGVPFQPELAMGAIGEGGTQVLDRSLAARIGVTETELQIVERRERAILEDRVARLRRGRRRLDLTGRVAVVVDDGIATGATARVACQVARSLGAALVVLAVPVAPAGTVGLIREADEVVTVSTPARFSSVGEHYLDFSPTTDEEVVCCWTPRPGGSAPGSRRGSSPTATSTSGSPPTASSSTGTCTCPSRRPGWWCSPTAAAAAGRARATSSSPGCCSAAGLGTLLLDLLTPEEERGPRRTSSTSSCSPTGWSPRPRWLAEPRRRRGLPVGYFGASTGAGAACGPPPSRASGVGAVVSRGGRPDLAAPRLGEVAAPTLLVVGSEDRTVLELNRQTMDLLRCPRELAVVEGATHLFEESGTLAEAALLAADWFVAHLLADPSVQTRKALR